MLSKADDAAGVVVLGVVGADGAVEDVWFFWFAIWSTIVSIVVFPILLLLTALGDDAHTPSLALSPAVECP
jgi:hypothetical protein